MLRICVGLVKKGKSESANEQADIEIDINITFLY